MTDSNIIPVAIRCRDSETVTVSGERITEHFALTPTIANRDDGSYRLTASLALTHIPTGLAVSSSTWIDLRTFAVELELLPIDWATLTKPTSEQAVMVRGVADRLIKEQADEEYWPWPEWAGDESTPAVSTLVGRLDDALKHSETRKDSKALAGEVAKLDKDLGRKVDGGLLWRDCALNVEGYGVIYLLAVLHRVDPAAADRAAANLVRDWDAGDSLGEWIYQWRQEIADGHPLTLHGFADLPIVEVQP